jgi:hypothetical protein
MRQAIDLTQQVDEATQPEIERRQQFFEMIQQAVQVIKVVQQIR